MHEKEVLRIVFLAFPLDYPGRHGISRDPSSSNEGIDLPA